MAYTSSFPKVLAEAVVRYLPSALFAFSSFGMKVTDSRITAALVETINGIIEGPGGSLTKWKRVIEELGKFSIPYSANLSIWEVMVHPENRAGLGLNTFQVHKTLKTIKEIGADAEAVHRATCFEMAPAGQARQGQIAFNQGLIDRSNGQLAKLSGRERVMSVACSHFCAGCRAADASCLTPEDDLADENGKLNKLQLVNNDAEFASLIDKGWSWTVLPFCVQEVWPKLPDLAQDALNAEHATFSMASELQVMLSMSNRAAQQRDGIDWSKIKADIRASQPPCVEYLDIISRFVQMYAGGANAPIVRYLEGFGKEYGGSNKLGQGFLEAVTTAKFPTEATKFPFTRSALIATNLVSPKDKVVDGIARLVNKSDVSMLTRKASLLQVTAAEACLAEAWDALQTLPKRGLVQIPECNALFGRLSSRIILQMIKKQKDGPENSKYKGIQAIKAAFESEVNEQLGVDVSTLASDSHVPSSNHTPDREELEDIANLSDPVWIAGQKGFAVGGIYIMKKSEGESMVFKLDGLDPSGATFTEVSLAPGERVTKHVGFDDLKSWSECKNKVQVRAAEFDTAPWMGDAHTALLKDADRAKLFGELMLLASVRSTSERQYVDFLLHPAEVRAKVDIPKSSLSLVPVTELGKVTSKAGSGMTTVVGNKGALFVLDAPNRPKTNTKEEWKKDHVLSAFWWVKSSSVQSECNMKLVKCKVDNFTFQCMENSKVIKAWEKLTLFDGDTAEGPPKKKAR